MEISNPSILRICRKAGVKNLSEDSYDLIRVILFKRMDEIIQTSLAVNNERQTKTLMAEDMYNSLSLLGVNLTRIDSSI